MAQPYVGQIRIFAGNFPPAGWMFCEGQLLPISENEVLFQLIGTTYGGDGESTFALPDLRGRIPIHQGNGFILAETGGAEEITLSVNQIPVHAHALKGPGMIAYGAGRGNTSAPAGNYPAVSPGLNLYSTEVRTNVNMNSPAIANPNAVLTAVGGSQPHTNMQPFLCVSYIISLFGIFPSPA